MVLDGKTIAYKNYVTPVDDEQVQPNGVDLRVKEIWAVDGKAYLDADSKMHFMNMNKYSALEHFDNGESEFVLYAGTHYAVDFMETVSVPERYCAIIYPRSSLLRAGAFVTSALWDTGFEGQLGGFIRPMCDLYIHPKARIAQIVFTKANFNGHRYDGRYQGATSQLGIYERQT